VTVRLALLALLAGFAATACGGRSSLTVINTSSTQYVVRIQPEGNASFGFLIPPNTTAQAWRNQAGSISAWALVLTPDCQQVAKWLLEPSGGSIEIDAAGLVSVSAASAQPVGRWLEYSSACSHPEDGLQP